MNKARIPDWEYKERIKKATKLIQEKELDALIINSNEADFANVRYFSGFWPLFERAGVAISAKGKSALMVGPESDIFAKDVSRIENIFVLMAYRESADPSYPELSPSSYNDVFKSIGVSGKNLRIGVASYLDTNIVIYKAIENAFPDAEIVRADEIMVELRSIKSENEIECLKEGFKIVKYATEEVIKALKPGVTECQMVGVAQEAIYKHGAEYEGLPMYVFSEKSTRHAISRSHPDKIIGRNDIVQLNLSARLDGYSPSIGMPVCMGKLNQERRDVIEFGLKAHNWTETQLEAGKKASDVAKAFYKFYKDNGYEKNYLYGPCHGIGMIEVEAPWMETDSNYDLKPNMTFQVDTFIMGDTFGVRWEKGIVIKEGGCEALTEPLGTIHELDF
jgi:Xaa-Pro aminopeptidase